MKDFKIVENLSLTLSESKMELPPVPSLVNNVLDEEPVSYETIPNIIAKY